MSGKTTVATKRAQKLKSDGYGVLVLDPLLDPEWGADYITHNGELFMQVVFNSTSCGVFVDESGQSIGKYNTYMEQLATRGRHFGHKCHFICQRAQQISKTMRAQCTEAFIFNICKSDAKDLAEEFNAPELLEAHNLRQGECFWVRRFQPIEKINAFEL